MSRVDIPCRIVRISVRRYFCPSIRPSVRQSVRPSMRRPSVHPLGPHSVVIRFASYRIVSHRIVSYRIVKCRASHIVSCCREGVSCDRRVCVREVEPWVLRIHITAYGLDSSARHVPYRVMTSSNESCLKLYAAPHHISAYPPFCPPIHPPDSPSRLPARPPCQYSGRTSARRCGRRRGPHRAVLHIGGIASCRAVWYCIVSYRIVERVSMSRSYFREGRRAVPTKECSIIVSTHLFDSCRAMPYRCII